MNVKEALTRKFGPLPAYAWLGILAVVVIAYRHFFPAPAAPAETQGSNLNTLDGNGGLGRGGAAGGGGSGSLDAVPPPAAELGGSTGTPVIYDPVSGDYEPPPWWTGPLPWEPEPTAPYAEPSYATTYADLGVTPTPITLATVAPAPKLPAKGAGLTVPKSLRAKAVKPAPKRAIQPVRPSNTKGRQTPRKPKPAPVKRHAPARVAVHKPSAAPVRKAPPMPPPKKRKAVLRAAARQAWNHREPLPVVRSRSLTAVSSARTAAASAPPDAFMRAVQARSAPAAPAPPPAPVRTAAPSPPPQLAPGQIPRVGKAYAE